MALGHHDALKPLIVDVDLTVRYSRHVDRPRQYKAGSSIVAPGPPNCITQDTLIHRTLLRSLPSVKMSSPSGSL